MLVKKIFCCRKLLNHYISRKIALIMKIKIYDVSMQFNKIKQKEPKSDYKLRKDLV